MTWQLQDAKNKLSQVIAASKSSGPQRITVRGKDAAVVLSAEDYRRLTRKRVSLLAFLQRSPFADVDLEIDRSSDKARELTL